MRNQNYLITGVNHITLATKNVTRSFDFYRNILGFKPLCKWNAGAYFLAGDMWFCLNYDEYCSAGTDYTHIAFTVNQSNFKSLKDKIITNNITIFKDNRSEGDSLYFLDPDGHKLEVHVGDWQSRIALKKQNIGNWEDVEFYV